MSGSRRRTHWMIDVPSPFATVDELVRSMRSIERIADQDSPSVQRALALVRRNLAWRLQCAERGYG